MTHPERVRPIHPTTYLGLAPLVALAAGLVGCLGEVGPDQDRPSLPGRAGSGALLAGLTLVGETRLGPTRVIQFFDSDAGILIRDSGRIEELAEQRVDLDGLRRRGLGEMFRELAGDGAIEVPAPLLEAERRWAVRAVDGRPPDNAPVPALAPSARMAADRAGLLQAPSEDAAWWQSLPICDAIESTGSFAGPAWYDGVWCPIDRPWAQTAFRDTMYYEATGLGQDGVATIAISKFVDGQWREVIHQDIPHRYFQTFSFPPENGAFFWTTIHGELDGHGDPVTNVGLSERYRLAMPQPSFLSFGPSQSRYPFSTDINGLTNDANNFYMTRTDHNIAAPWGGYISKTPMSHSLGDQPPQVAEMPRLWAQPDSEGSPTRYNHFGDLVHVDGRLYVAMEGPAGAAVGVFDTDLRPLGFAALSTTERSCPWIAHNPRNGMFYTPFSSKTSLAIFTIRVDGTSVRAARVGDLRMAAPIGDQGAKFSRRGNLWSVSGYGGSASLRLFGADSVNGHVHFSASIPSNGGDEAEGLDLIDLDADGRAPGGAGQLHVQTLENTVFGHDKLSLGHFRADMDRL